MGQCSNADPFGLGTQDQVPQIFLSRQYMSKLPIFSIRLWWVIFNGQKVTLVLHTAPARLEDPLLAVGFGIDATDQRVVPQDRQGGEPGAAR